MKKPLILMISDSMDSNKKEGRDESALVRMAKTARNHMGFESQVELWPNTENPIEGKIKRAMLLNIFHAFRKDVQQVSKAIKEGKLDPKDINRVGFVTSDVYSKLVGNNNKPDMWISETVEEIPIGADPEFLLFSNDGAVQSATSISGFSHNSQIGSDGAMAELRPDPATTTEGLVANIRKLFNNKELTKPIKDLEWRSGCYYHDGNRAYPIGGHIHLGNPLKISKIDQTNRMYFFRAVNKIMDELLAVPLIRLDADEGKGRRVSSNMGRYGFFGELRMSSGRLEHRTLSGVWLTHPDIAAAVIGTAKAILEEVYRFVSDKKFSMDYIVHEYLKSASVFGSSFNKWEEIPLTHDLECIKSSGDMHKLLNEASMKHVNVSFINRWYSRMKRLSTYKQYSPSIDMLYTILKAPKEKITSLNMNLKDNWVKNNKLNI